MDSQSIEANKAIVQRVVEEMWNRGDEDAVEELIAPGMVEHGAFGAGAWRPRRCARHDHALPGGLP